MKIVAKPISDISFSKKTVIIDITKCVLMSSHWYYDSYGNHVFTGGTGLEIIIPIQHSHSRLKYFQVKISIPITVKKDSRFVIIVESIDTNKYMFNIVQNLHNLDILDVDVIEVFCDDGEQNNCSDGIENKENNIEEGEIMFASFKIENIELELPSETKVELNGTSIEIGEDKVIVKAENKVKSISKDEFINLIQSKFKDIKIKDLTSSEKSFLNESGLVKAVKLVQINSIDDLLF